MNIGFFCYSPASINSFYPLISDKSDFVNIRLFFGSSFARDFFFKNDSMNCFNLSIFEDFSEFISDCDVLFYGTGSVGELEGSVPFRAKELSSKIVTVAIQDIFWSSIDNLKRRYSIKPDYVIVSSFDEKNKLINDCGFEGAQILIFGNPHFARLSDFHFYSDRPPLSVSFISQCDVGATYDESTHPVCQEAILSLLEMKRSNFISDLIIYKHPRENTSFFDENNIPISDTNDFLDMLRSDYGYCGGAGGGAGGGPVLAAAQLFGVPDQKVDR